MRVADLDKPIQDVLESKDFLKRRISVVRGQHLRGQPV